MQAPGPTADERIEMLERENQELRRALRLRTWAGVACLALLSLATAAGRRRQQPTPAGLPRLIEAEGFIVRDEAGEVRATLGRTGGETDRIYSDETGLRLWVDGKQRAALTVEGHGWGAVTLSDKEENARMLLLGESDGAGLTLRDKKGDMRLDLVLHDDGTPKLSLLGNKERSRLQIGFLSNEIPYFDIFSKEDDTYSFIGNDGIPLDDKGRGPR